uniref:GMP reductase n=1 Tax=Scophthalmus maximus TaxID=52904 RepID=A0A8D3CA67_SCOMX
MPRIENDIKLDFKDVLLRPKRSTLKSRSEVDLMRNFSFRNSKGSYRGIPIVAANMDTVGTFEMALALHQFTLFTTIHKHYSVDEWLAFAAKNPDCLESLAVSTGTGDGDFEKMSAILAAAGNVVTGEMVEELILAGADIIKVGIGPGSVCTTRKKTGVGYPQLSAVIECADAAHGLGGHIISDGGCTCPGDVSKAFGAGADFVMLGGMLAGHSESGGEIIEKNSKKYKLFYGMSSDTAMKRHAGGVAEYRASEGKTVEVPYKGPVDVTIRDILGGVRSTCTYVGAGKLKELSRRTTFIRVTQQLNTVFGNDS